MTHGPAVSTVLLMTVSTLAPNAQETVGEHELSFWQSLKDPEDGKLDLTARRSGGATGFVPLVIPFNGPAIGAGTVLAGIYFHPRESDTAGASVTENPPSMTFGGLAASDNDTAVLVGGHTEAWNDGRSRYSGLLGLASVNLRFYGIGEDAGSEASGLKFNLAGTATSHQAKFRVADSRFFWGLQYSFLASDVTIDAFQDSPIALGNSDNAGLSTFLQYDSRDNTYTPNRGTRGSMDLGRYDKSLGGDFDYWKADAVANQFWSVLSERLILGFRFEYHFAEDGAPFYGLPFVTLRGVPAMRYLGNHSFTTELEPRWKIGTRWSVLGFAGTARAATEFDKLADAEDAYNYGVGFRYLLARALGLGVGFDVAQGPEESVLSHFR